ncbi:MAG: alpha/beta hydrolase, partial [Gemmatimonadota bacterium]|nr:alpha/beta hydrolase [Gemmatimonadota bacterium]
GNGPHPLVLIIAGSGPTDRDGNSPVPIAPGKTLHTDSYKLLAAALAAHGIASVRYDKRGVAASVAAMAGQTESDYRFDTGVDDAAAWIRMLRADRRFSTIVVVGHSEGSLVGMLAAQRATADGFISLEGAGRPAAEVIREQLLAAGTPPALFDAILDSLSAGKLVANPPPALASLFRASVQPYLISWFRYDPAAETRKLPYATLVIQGTHDIQVSARDADRLASGGNTTLLTIDGMTHVLKKGPPDAAAQVASVYADPSAPLAPEVAAAIVSYVRNSSQPQ